MWAMRMNFNKRDNVIILSNLSSFIPTSGKIDDLCFELMDVIEE
jgi:hypothetical protein